MEEFTITMMLKQVLDKLPPGFAHEAFVEQGRLGVEKRWAAHREAKARNQGGEVVTRLFTICTDEPQEVK